MIAYITGTSSGLGAYTAQALVDAGWTVVLPDVLDVPSANRTARNLTGVEFEARLAGAVHTVTVNGRITA